MLSTDMSYHETVSEMEKAFGIFPGFFKGVVYGIDL